MTKSLRLRLVLILIEWSAPAYSVRYHQTKLTNVTSGFIEQIGSSEFTANGSDNTATRSFGTARVNITADTTYKIEHYCKEVKDSEGLGDGGSSGENEIYTQVTITDLAVLAAGGGSGGGGDTIINYSGASAWGHIACKPWKYLRVV